MNGLELITALKETMSNFDITPSQLINCEDIEQDVWAQIIETFGDYKQVFEERDPYKNNHERHDEVVVLEFMMHNVFVMFEGEYSSWEGTSFEDGPFLCEPIEVKTIQYQKVSS